MPVTLTNVRDLLLPGLTAGQKVDMDDSLEFAILNSIIGIDGKYFSHMGWHGLTWTGMNIGYDIRNKIWEIRDGRYLCCKEFSEIVDIISDPEWREARGYEIRS